MKFNKEEITLERIQELSAALRQAIRYPYTADIGFIERGDAELVLKAAQDHLSDMLYTYQVRQNQVNLGLKDIK
jgi:hypothetical protein